MITAGMAATRPKAVASRASAMPGATTARLVVCVFEMPMKLFMMPQTVPKRPMKGAVAPIVPRMPVPRLINRPARASIRSMQRRGAFLDAVGVEIGRAVDLGGRGIDHAHHRAFAPSSSARAASSVAAGRGWRAGFAPFASRQRVRCSWRYKPSRSASEAKARPTITIFTMMSALRNMPQGREICGSRLCRDRSRRGLQGGHILGCGFGAPATGRLEASARSRDCGRGTCARGTCRCGDSGRWRGD